jgi:uncharacterized membrane protein YvlD (DUF360 family)
LIYYLLQEVIHKEVKKKDIISMIIIGIVILIILGLSIRIVNQYERGVVFRLGKVIGVKEPGLRLIIPLVDRMVKPSLQIVTMPIPSQKIITQDNVSIDVAAVAYFKVVDAYKAVVEIENYNRAVNQISQTTVRSVVGQFTWMKSYPKPPKSTRRSRRSSTTTVNHGESRLLTWRSRISNYQTACKGLLHSRQRLKGRKEPKSSRPKENTWLPANWVKQQTSSPSTRWRSSCESCRFSVTSLPRRTPP